MSTFTFDHADGDWWRVGGPGLPDGLAVRFAYRGAGFAVTGLRLESEQVTAAMLRRIPVGALAAAHLQYWQQELNETELGVSWARAGVEVGRDVWEEFIPAWQRRTALVAWAERLQAEGASVPRGRGRGARPPDAQDLRGFASVYLQKAAENPRTAVSATAREVGMDRSTAHRWLQRCRAVPGLLPETPTTGDPR